MSISKEQSDEKRYELFSDDDAIKMQMLRNKKEFKMRDRSEEVLKNADVRIIDKRLYLDPWTVSEIRHFFRFEFKNFFFSLWKLLVENGVDEVEASVLISLYQYEHFPDETAWHDK